MRRSTLELAEEALLGRGRWDRGGLYAWLLRFAGAVPDALRLVEGVRDGWEGGCWEVLDLPAALDACRAWKADADLRACRRAGMI